MIGPNIILREYRAEDIDAIRAFVLNNDITQYLSAVFLQPHTREFTLSFLDRVLKGEDNAFRFVVARRDDESYLGQIDLFAINRQCRSGELGVTLGAEDRLGRGIGTEAIGLLLDFAFGYQNLHRVHLRVRARNARAIRCYEKCGFVKEGTQREAYYFNGEYGDDYVMAILEQEWRKMRGR